MFASRHGMQFAVFHPASWSNISSLTMFEEECSLCGCMTSMEAWEEGGIEGREGRV